MSVLDDLASAGLSAAQAQAVVLEDLTLTNVDGLVASGFSTTQAIAMNAYDLSTTAVNLDMLVQQGIWSGTALTAIDAALDVTP